MLKTVSLPTEVVLVLIDGVFGYGNIGVEFWAGPG